MSRWHRGAYVGKFQPFHKGHLKCVKYVLDRVEELIIVLGSSQYSHSLENPFTAGERIEMIRLALREAGIPCDRYMIVPVPDTNCVHALWVARVVSYTPKFEVVFSNEPLTRRLFYESGFEVQNIPFFDREVLSATEVRRRMISGENWEELVPPIVAKYIKSIKGVERLKSLAIKDKPPFKVQL
ncbi:MAG: nicotinamide-nucleotide adenylyltransferase [archaeon GB-1867-005]|nr:nicotinamide-nucleotide adenylyltransferase [Candidatus Culexmicrobium cathedralense]